MNYDWRRAAPRGPELETEFITGWAGTGKTYEVQRRKVADPEGVVLSATTGIAGVNLGPDVKTINSLLRFYNYRSLADAHASGRLQRGIRKLVDSGMRELVIDEISMFSALHLDVLYNAFREVSLERPGIKVTIAGDFAQLRPIPDRESPGTERYAFDAECWRPHFSENSMRLTRIWRQENEEYLGALHAARRGAGDEALAHLQSAGVRFEPRLSDEFEGTTLIAINEEVDDYNLRRPRLFPGDNARVPVARSTRWTLDGREQEWSSIPNPFLFKAGAYVMLLSNSAGWVNGDCGTVVRGTIAGTEDDYLGVRLKRNNNEVRVQKIIRERTTRSRPTVPDADILVFRTRADYDARVRENGGEPLRQVVMLQEPHPEWITGWIRYFPLRLAYATTVHKSQGLSLDAIQLDLRSNFLASPAMMYVALSRCRTPEGLVLVGTPDQVVAKTCIDPRVTEWL